MIFCDSFIDPFTDSFGESNFCGTDVYVDLLKNAFQNRNKFFHGLLFLKTKSLKKLAFIQSPAIIPGFLHKNYIWQQFKKITLDNI